MPTATKRKACAICQTPDPEMVMALPATPLCDDYVAPERVGEPQDSYPLDLYFCDNCGLLQLLDIVDPKAVYADYLYETSASLGLEQHFQQYADDILSNLGIPGGRLVIDIGCNDGTLLKCFRHMGMRVLGVEPARAIAQKVQSSGIEVIPEFFSCKLAKKIRQQHGPAAIVAANNVMANVLDLHDFVRGVAHLLDEDGVFVFETGYGVDVVREHLVDTIYHEHLYYLNTISLCHLFQQHGLELINIERNSSKGGSLRGVAQVAGGPRTISPAVAERENLEISLGFDSAQVYKNHAGQIEGLRTELRALLEEIRSKGKTVAVYGASAGVTTLLYFFGIGSDVEYLLDDNPARHGLLSPGYHIPVKPSDEIYARNPDYVLILAWRYAETISNRHTKYSQQGGRFIVPLPGVRVI